MRETVITCALVYPRMMRRCLSSLLLIIGQTACTTTEIDEFRQAATGIDRDDKIVILGSRQNNNYETEVEFIECLGSVVGSGSDGISVINEREFLDAMFPYFEPRTAPTGIARLRALMSDGMAKARLEELGLGYIIWVDGLTQRGGEGGSISCTIGPGGGGCFGFGTWEDTSNFEAQVWDLKTQDIAGSINTGANGQSYVPALVLPIPLIARVEANACSGLGNQLKQFINGS